MHPMNHAGVNAHDPRNAGIIAWFQPTPVSREMLVAALQRAPDSPIVRRSFERALEKLERRAGPPELPPLSQSLDQVAEPWFGLGTHPDIIAAMWKLDGLLPQPCKWVFSGYPALVHPQNGIVFAVGFGTIGIALRLSPQALADPRFASLPALPERKGRQDVDAGPEWRLVRLAKWTAEVCRAAYEFAG
jgi:hypothetical protein